MLGVAAGTFVLALCIFGGFKHQQSQAVQSTSAEARPQAQSRVFPTTTPELKEQFVERAKVLREKWKPWALKHQVMLKRMLNASPSGEAAMLAVWNEVPASPYAAGFTAQELMPSGDPSVGVGFGWAGVSKNFATAPTPSNPDDAAMMRRFALAAPSSIRREFQRRRDIVVIGGGMRTETSLWASGRITQRDVLNQTEHQEMMLKRYNEHRQPTAEDQYKPEQEIVPPYDFLSNFQASKEK